MAMTGFPFPFIRMLFSCLVDADSLDTEAFMSPQMSAFRGKFDSTEVLSEVFSDFIEKSLHLPLTQLSTG